MFLLKGTNSDHEVLQRCRECDATAVDAGSPSRTRHIGGALPRFAAPELGNARSCTVHCQDVCRHHAKMAPKSLKHCGCDPLRISRALRNKDSTSRHDLMAEIRMISPQNRRMRIAETATQVRKRRNWLFSEGVWQGLAHSFYSLPLHLCHLLGDYRAQLWKDMQSQPSISIPA